MIHDIINGKLNWERWPFHLFKQDNTFLLLLTFAVIILLTGILYFTGGNIKASAAFLGIISIVILTFYRLDYSFLLLFGFVLIFDQELDPRLVPAGFYPVTAAIFYFKNLNAIPYLPDIPIVINPIELHLMLLLFVWFLIVVTQRSFKLQNIPVWPAFLLFLFWFILSFFKGLLSGGEFLVALWEIRALFYFSVMYIIVPHLIRTRRQIRILIWICIIALFVKACQGIYRYAAMGFTTGGIQTFTNHEDPVFITVLLIFLAAMLLSGYKDRQRTTLLLLSVPFLLGYYVSFRRAAIAGLIVSFAAFFILIGSEERKKYLKLAVPGVILLLIYGAAFWNSEPENKLAVPVQMVKSGLVTPSLRENPGDYYSNLYRDYENYNLSVTVQRMPVAGIGFGNKYDMPLELVDIPFPLRDYIPHNQIIWWLVKTGTIGFFTFWLFFNAYVYKGAAVFARLHDPWLKAVCAMAVVAVINQMVVSYFDLQLTFYRNMIFLGTFMGLLSTIERLGQESDEVSE